MWWQTPSCSPLLIYRAREDERLSWPCWWTYSGRLTHMSGHPSATGRAQDGERTLATDRRSTVEPRRPTCAAITKKTRHHAMKVTYNLKTDEANARHTVTSCDSMQSQLDLYQ